MRRYTSSLETMLTSFEQLYNELHDKDYFDNDDIAVILAKANLMASSDIRDIIELPIGTITFGALLFFYGITKKCMTLISST